MWWDDTDRTGEDVLSFTGISSDRHFSVLKSNGSEKGSVVHGKDTSTYQLCHIEYQGNNCDT